MSMGIHSGDEGSGKSTKNAQDLATILGGVEALVVLTDNSGGTGADTIAAIGGTYDQAEVRNAIASLADKINEILAQFT